MFRTLMITKNYFKRSISFVTICRTWNCKVSALTDDPLKIRIFSSPYSAINFIDTDYEDNYKDELEIEQIEQFEPVKNLLFPNSKDLILNDLKNSSSLEQVFSTLRRYDGFLKSEHLAQAVLVLKDLQYLCYRYGNFDASCLNDFNDDLKDSEEFQKLLNKVKNNLNTFDPKVLSYVFLFLYRLKLPAEDELMQLIAYKLRDHMEDEVKLDICSRLLRVIFSENSSRPYFICLKIVPKIINLIDICDSLEEFGHLTVCLNKLNHMLSSEVFNKYKSRVQYLIENKLSGKDYHIILKIVSFLNYPKWRSENSVLISNCILKMKKEINVLNTSELLLLYEVFFKNQEPGDVLNDIQRHAAKYLQQMKENEFIDLETHLRLFSAFIYFSPPIHRSQFKTNLDKYLKKTTKMRVFDLQRKILTYVKTSNKKICEDFWNMGVQLLDQTTDINDAAQICVNYKRFNTDLTNYRHYVFEGKILDFIRNILDKGDLIFPTDLTIFLSFAMVYSNDDFLLYRLIQKFEENISHIKATDCLLISESLSKFKTNHLASKYSRSLHTILHKITKRLYSDNNSDFVQNNVLVKAAILRKDNEDFILEDLLYEYKTLDYMCSKLIENLYHIFLATDSIIPEVINKCTEYVVNHSNVIVGFNAEKILTMCYYLGYHPINCDQFFETVINIILRDQERLSGLAFLQSALSLSFFNKLPIFFIKQIFNVEFMDKLDLELANCYSKDVYPQRVRWRLMHLNRAVCLQYPELNIPWFHKKFVEEANKRRMQEPETKFTESVRVYLAETVDKGMMQENVIAPYGFMIDYLICFDRSGTIVYPQSSNISRRLALLLLKPHAYTKFYIHLKGKYQMKIRHLELLGYEVGIVKFSEWINLLYSEERLEYLRKIIWPHKEKESKLQT